MKVAFLLVSLGVLAGCAGPMQRGVSSSEHADVLHSEMLSRFDNPTAAPSSPGATDAARPPQHCQFVRTGYRVRDLSVPWAQRRYLVPDGTVAAPRVLRVHP